MINCGYAPGVIGRIVVLHLGYHALATGFGAPFEARVAADLAASRASCEKPGFTVMAGDQDR